MKKQTVFLLAGYLLSAPVLSEELTVNLQLANGTEPLTDAVVYLNDGSEASPVQAEVVQKDRMFHPHVLILPTGSSVNFPNRDNTQHHVYSFSPAKSFDLELYAGQPEAPIVFDQPGIVELGCNIHDHMQAFIVLADTRAISQSDEQGKVTLTLDFGVDPIPDSLSLNIWHPRLRNNTRPVVREINSSSVTNNTVKTLNIEVEPESHQDGPMDHLQKRFREL